MEALNIDKAMIQRHIDMYNCEYNETLTEAEARMQLENLKTQGCLLYEDCRSCPKFGKCCPL